MPNSFWYDLIDLAGSALNPKRLPQHLEAGLHDMQAPLNRVLSGETFKSMANAKKDLLELPVQTGLGLSFALPAVAPDKPEYDQAGPMEESAGRLGNLASGIAGFSPKMYSRGMGRGMAAAMLSGSLMEELAPKAGRFADWMMSTRPTPQEMFDRFNERITPKAQDIMKEHPEVSQDDAARVATANLLQEVPNYLDWVPK